MNKGKIAGIILIILCVLVNLFEGARMEALAPSVIFCIIGLILIIKKPKKEKIQKDYHNPYVDVSLYDNDGTLPLVNYPNLFLHQGEWLIYAVPASTFVEIEQIVGYAGGSTVSVNVAKGVSVRTGSSKGKPIRRNVAKLNNGDFVVTNNRIIFIAQNESFEFSANKISATKIIAKNAFLIAQGNKHKNICVDESQVRYAVGLTNFVIGKEQKA